MEKTGLRLNLASLGVNESNFTENWLIYSLIVSQSLDSATSAVGRIDAEAARHLRTAYGMARHRIDLLFRMAYLGPEDKNGASFMVNSKAIKEFGIIFPITSETAAAAFSPENLHQTLIDLAAAIDIDASIENLAIIEGALVGGLARIALVERMLYLCNPGKLAHPVGHEQMYTVFMLQQAAITIHDLILGALQLIQSKIQGKTGMLCCMNCGLIVDQGDIDNCPLCGSPANFLCQYPVKPSPEALEAVKKSETGRYVGHAVMDQFPQV